jgi:phosphopantothenoylcysteine decarboxylase/phosphopantothenate--cysteine ligase
MIILVTAGGTEEPIDGVRRLVNSSTGATGLAIANRLREHGADVLLLHSTRVDVSCFQGEKTPFLTFDDLSGALENLLGKRRFDAVVHLAAVSDYHLAGVEVDGKPLESGERGKIGTGHELLLRLAPNPKLIDSLRDWSSNPELSVVGFKLTDEENKAKRTAKARALLQRGVADYVVHNDINEISTYKHIATVHSLRGVVAETQTKNELAEALCGLLAVGESL